MSKRPRFDVTETVKELRAVSTMGALARALESIIPKLGFRYFALIHHLHPKDWSRMAICLHNCEPDWPIAYAGRKLYRGDPILRACTLTNVGFKWGEISSVIPTTEAHRHYFDQFSEAGIGDGMTIPAHIPGEPPGSCNFATAKGQPFPDQSYISALIVGAFAFQAARRIAGFVKVRPPTEMPLTVRQRDCLLWAMRGKTNWEIGQILGLSRDTVSQHLDMARIRYGVTKRLQLAVRAIYMGEISLDDALY